MLVQTTPTFLKFLKKSLNLSNVPVDTSYGSNPMPTQKMSVQSKEGAARLCLNHKTMDKACIIILYKQAAHVQGGK